MVPSFSAFANQYSAVCLRVELGSASALHAGLLEPLEHRRPARRPAHPSPPAASWRRTRLRRSPATRAARASDDSGRGLRSRSATTGRGPANGSNSIRPPAQGALSMKLLVIELSSWRMKVGPTWLFFSVHRLRHDELRIEPCGLGTVGGRRLRAILYRTPRPRWRPASSAITPINSHPARSHAAISVCRPRSSPAGRARPCRR